MGWDEWVPFVSAMLIGALVGALIIVAAFMAARAGCEKAADVQGVDRYWSWNTGCIPTDPNVVVTQ